MTVKDLISKLSNLPQSEQSKEILIWDGWMGEYHRFDIGDGTSYHYGKYITDGPGYLDDVGLKALKVKIKDCVALSPKRLKNRKLDGVR